jgi:hypothetical protein
MRVLLLLSFTFGLAGCFDPDLGSTPFRCAAEGKKCPDGYTCRENVCVEEGDADGSVAPADQRILTDAELVPSKEGPVYIDGAPQLNYANCIDNADEPNNSRGDATTLPPGQTDIPGWEICPAGDVDQFSVELEVDQVLKVVVEFQHDSGDLEAALVDPDGRVIDASRSETNDEELMVAGAKVKGSYIIGVYGFSGQVNQYGLKLTYE